MPPHLPAEELFERSRSLWRAGEYDAAIDGFSTLADRPDAAESHTLALIQAYLSVAEIQLALQRLETLPPTSPGVWILTALAQHRSGDCESFLREARRALDAFPNHPHVRALARIAGATVPGLAASSTERLLLECAEFVGSHCPPGTLLAYPRDVLLNAIALADRALPAIECGVFRGLSLGIIAARWKGEVHGFDSFRGLPKAWGAREAAGTYSTGGALPHVAPNVELHAGWFDETLPEFLRERNIERIGLLHVDCDIYRSTQTVLSALDAGIGAGTVIVFDDFVGYPEYQKHELRAWEEYVQETGIRYRPLHFAMLAREASFVVTGR